MVVGLSACGLSRHRYSVGQVEAAFASQGVELRKAATQKAAGVVVLRHGRRPHFIVVVVRTGSRSGRQYLDSASRHAHVTRRGNVIAISDPGYLAAVRSALAELH